MTKLTHICPECEKPVEHHGDDVGYCDTCNRRFHWGLCGGWGDAGTLGQHECRLCKRIRETAEVEADRTNEMSGLMATWTELEAELEAHARDLRLTFGMEFSSTVDWVVDLTPGCHHPKAREYGNVWRGQGSTPASAIQRALKAMRAELESAPETDVPKDKA